MRAHCIRRGYVRAEREILLVTAHCIRERGMLLVTELCIKRSYM